MKIYLDSIGCRLNHSELEILAADLRAQGHQIVADPSIANAAIINSCAVTNAAVADSRQLVHKLNKRGVETIYLTGCWASVEELELSQLPANVHIVTNNHKDAIVQNFFATDFLGSPKPSPRIALPGKGHRTRAFIKVQEGCDFHCTYCFTRIARGKSISRSETDVLLDVRSASLGDVKEVVLTGTQLGGWGRDLQPRKSIADLVAFLLKESDIPKIRLSSIEPWDVKETLFPYLANDRFCPHLHLPLQSGSDLTLKRMARVMDSKTYSTLVQKIRTIDPDIAITTDLLVGFPGETPVEFEESVAFVREMQFAGGHVFRYSSRPLTPAADYPDQVSDLDKKERNQIMRKVVEESSNRYKAKYIGKVVPVLWEQAKEMQRNTWQMIGLTGNYLRVHAISTDDLWNAFSEVKIIEDKGNFLQGHIL